MIPRTASPIGHVTPRPPIEINPRHCVTTGGPDYVPLSPEECERLWRLIKGAAEGSNIGETQEVDDSGWGAA